MAIESSFIPFPSEAVVPPAAWLAQQGTLDIVLVVVVATLGADLGGLINYALAYWLDVRSSTDWQRQNGQKCC